MRETKKVSVEGLKISKKYAWKQKSVREESEISVRESDFLCVHEREMIIGA